MGRAGAAVAITVILGITFEIGRAYANARRGWADYQVTRRSVSGLRRAAMGCVGLTARWMAGLAVVLAVVAAIGRR